MMSRRPRVLLGVLSIVAVASVCLVPIVDAQSVPTPGADAEPWTSQTPWGDPDLQGVWASDSATPFERPSAVADREFLTDEEVALLQRRAAELFDGNGDAAFGDSVYEAVINDAKTFSSRDTTTGDYNQFWLVDRWFENRTSLIVDPPDGKIPALTPEAQARQEALQAQAARADGSGESALPGGPEDFPAGLRCTAGLVPMTGRGYNSNHQIVQAPGFVAISLERTHDVRIIPLDGRPHATPNLRSDVGDSRGYWQGNTLVVETTNLKSGPRELSASTGEQLRLTERFSRVNAETLRYEFTVNDPATWTKPWTAVIFMRPAPGTGLMYEYACHEGNYAIGNALRGARAEEAETAKVSN